MEWTATRRTPEESKERRFARRRKSDCSQKPLPKDSHCPRGKNPRCGDSPEAQPGHLHQPNRPILWWSDTKGQVLLEEHNPHSMNSNQVKVRPSRFQDGPSVVSSPRLP